MSRKKGTLNVPKKQINEIMEKHRAGATARKLSEEYGRPFKTIKNIYTRENGKARLEKESLMPTKVRERKVAVSLGEYKYENKRLKMENELLRDFLYLAGRK